MKIKELKNFINKSTIPEVKAMPKTFLGIAKQPHYENVLSNLYAFYFEVEEEHGLSNLFINSLIDVIKRQIKKFTFSSGFEVYREYPTNKAGRIDIVIENDNESIIIENKVFHRIENDLEDYWDSVETKYKTAIVLSLHPVMIDNENFINITHIELFNEIFKNIGSYLLNSENKYLIFLKDIYQNIINLTNNMDNRQIQFYFENQEKINEIVEVNDIIIKHVKNEVDFACEQLDENLILNHKRGEGYRYYTSGENKNLMFTISYDSIFSSENIIHIIIELQEEAIEFICNVEQLNFTDKERDLICEGIENCNDSYFHFVSKPYDVNKENIKELRNFIVEKIKNDGFLSIFKKLENILSE